MKIFKERVKSSSSRPLKLTARFSRRARLRFQGDLSNEFLSARVSGMMKLYKLETKILKIILTLSQRICQDNERSFENVYQIYDYKMNPILGLYEIILLCKKNSVFFHSTKI